MTIVRAPTFACVAGLVLALASPVRADLAKGFDGRVTVDAEYLTGIPDVIDIAFAADGRAVAIRKTGQIAVRRLDGTVVTVAYPFPGTLDTASEKGLLGVVADPRAGNAFFFYVSNGPSSEDKNRVYRAVLTDANTFVVDDPPIVAASRGLGPGLEGPGNHNAGGLSIVGEQLFISVGDTGANANPPTNRYASCLNKPNGKILRVNLDGSIPADNPLVGVTSVTSCSSVRGAWETGTPDRRIFAWGLRNPFRIWADPSTGLVWAGDVGQNTREEVSVLASGQHAGYPFEEGTQIWGDVGGRNCSSMSPSTPCTPPVHDYPTSGGAAVTGGLIVEGCGWSNVFGTTPHYLFGDSEDSFIRALAVNADRSGVASPAIDFASYSGARPVSFRMGRDHSLYAVMYGAGAVYRFTPTFRTGADCTVDGFICEEAGLDCTHGRCAFSDFGSPTCACDPGYENYGPGCRNTDECLTSVGREACNLGAHHTRCFDEEGSFRCYCESGFSVDENQDEFACQLVCGDGARGPGEECDDGDRAGGDGCSELCEEELLYRCFELPALNDPSVCFETCGDELIDQEQGEECDDGNREPGDGCDESCQREGCSTTCGVGLGSAGHARLLLLLLVPALLLARRRSSRAAR